MSRQLIDDGRHLVYVSTANPNLTQPMLDAILEGSRQWNAAHGITGILIYCHGSFMQYLEGPGKNVDICRERIHASRAHNNIVELINEPVRMRNFSQWHMGFTTASRGQLRSLLETRWRDYTQEENESGADGIGLIRHLMDSQRVPG